MKRTVVGELKGKKIAILGLGAEGRSLLKFLNEQGAVPSVHDRLNNIAAPEGARIFSIKLGEDYLEDIQSYDVVFRSPGLPRLHPALVAAEKAGVTISSHTKLFFELCPSLIIGVTGTKGKGTTASLVHEMILASSKQAFLGGNIGTPPLDFLKSLSENSIVVPELSSFQLQDLDISPSIALITNLASEHLDHHRTAEEYREAKLNILRYQDSLGCAILNADDEVLKLSAAGMRSKKYWFSTQAITEPGAYAIDGSLFQSLDGEEIKICDISEIKLRGIHNVGNILAASIAARLAGANIGAIRSVISSFETLPHRLKFIGKFRGVDYYDDSFGTIPETAMIALESFETPKVLILGGSEKKSSFAELARRIVNANVRGVVLVGETGPRIWAELQKAGYLGLVSHDAESMKEMVDAACSLAKPGDVVILSPASASFGMFRDYKDRGDQFVKEVLALK